MLPTDRAAFAKLIARHLGAYAKSPTPDEIAMWFDQLERHALEDIGRALEAHCQHHDDGKRAPRPIDVIRALRSGSTGMETCSVADAINGRCQYPGVFSEGTSGGGPWYCSWHAHNRSGPDAAKFIAASHEIPPHVAMERRVERMNAQANDSHAVRRLREAMAARGRRSAGNIGDLAHKAAGVEREPGDDQEAA